MFRTPRLLFMSMRMRRDAGRQYNLLVVFAIALAMSLCVVADGGAMDRTVLRVNLQSDLPGLDPLGFLGPVAGEVMAQSYEGLTEVAPDGSLAPALAVSWDESGNGRVWTFRLRDGVAFHTGRTLTARDVKRTFELALMPGRGKGMGTLFLRGVVGAKEVSDGKSAELAGVRVLDDLTVEVVLNEPDVLFPFYPLVVLDAARVEEGGDWTRRGSAGTGAFRLTDWTPGIGVRLEAHDRHWRGRPAVDEVDYRLLPNFPAAVRLYQAGELDYLIVPDDGLARVGRDTQLSADLAWTARAQARHLGMNAGLFGPFGDSRVRKAASLVLDRTAMVRGLFSGLAVVVPGTVTPGVSGFEPGALEPLRFDPEAARDLMRQAGYAQGVGMPPLELAGIDSMRTELDYCAQQFKRELGWPVTVRIYERGAFLAALNAGRLPFYLGGWTADYPDAMTFLESLWHSGSPFNRARWTDRRFDALLDQARSVASPGLRVGLYSRAERLLMDEAAMVPLPVPARVVLHRSELTGVGPTAFSSGLFRSVRIAK